MKITAHTVVTAYATDSSLAGRSYMTDDGIAFVTARTTAAGMLIVSMADGTERTMSPAVVRFALARSEIKAMDPAALLAAADEASALCAAEWTEEDAAALARLKARN